MIDTSDLKKSQANYVQQRMPEFAIFKPQQHQQKTYEFYKGKLNSWQRPINATKKTYPFFHKQADDNQQKIKQRQQYDQDDKNQEGQERIQTIITSRNLSLERLKTVKIKRKALQVSSSQKLDLVDVRGNINQELEQVLNDPCLKSHAINRAAFICQVKGTSDCLWNDYAKLGQKFSKQAVNPLIIKNDENAMMHYLKKFKEDKQIDDMRNECFQQKYKEIRKQFLKQQNLNDQKLNNQTIVNTNKIGRLRLSGSLRKFSEQMETITNSDQKFTKKRSNSSCQKLSFSNVQPTLKMSDQYILNNANECKGLILGDLDSLKANFTEIPLIQMVKSSKILHKKIQKSQSQQDVSRPNTVMSQLDMQNNAFNKFQKMSFKTIEIDENMNDEFDRKYSNVKETLDDMDNFEKKFSFERKQPGYPKIHLLESNLEDIRQVKKVIQQKNPHTFMFMTQSMSKE